MCPRTLVLTWPACAVLLAAAVVDATSREREQWRAALEVVVYAVRLAASGGFPCW